jgi:hypothetical protein
LRDEMRQQFEQQASALYTELQSARTALAQRRLIDQAADAILERDAAGARVH